MVEGGLLGAKRYTVEREPKSVAYNVRAEERKRPAAAEEALHRASCARHHRDERRRKEALARGGVVTIWDHASVPRGEKRVNVLFLHKMAGRVGGGNDVLIESVC